MLSNLIARLQSLRTENLFTYSAVVVDNDPARSAAPVIEAWQATTLIQIDYHSEPEQNIALARNRAVNSAKGDVVAFIDDDEFPEPTWLLESYKALRCFKADAVLGPVRPHFPEQTPEWLIRSRLCERPSYKTGTVLKGGETRTGNVLLHRAMFADPRDRFDPARGRTGGEDISFFRMMEAKGKTYVWCEEAPVYEIVPPERWTPGFYMRRSLRMGSNAGRRIRGLNNLPQSLYLATKSLFSLVFMALVVPVAWVLGRHLYMRVVTRLIYSYAFASSLAGRAVVVERED